MKTMAWLRTFFSKIKIHSGLVATGKISLAVLLVAGFISCEENMWLKSEKKLRGQIEGTWDKLFVTSHVYTNETWEFKDGTILITVTEKTDNHFDDGYVDLNKADGLDTMIMDLGNYSINAKIDNAYLTLSNLEENVVESAKQGLNAKWTIVDISNGGMYIAADNGTAIIQREFEKE